MALQRFGEHPERLGRLLPVGGDVGLGVLGSDRGDESVNEVIDWMLRELDPDWRTNAGFLTDSEAYALDEAVASGMAETDDSLDELGDEISERFRQESR